VAALTWAIVFAIGRYVSLASMLAAAALAASAWWLVPDATGRGVFGAGAATAGAILVIALHRANIRRLLEGREHRIGRRTGQRQEPPAPPGGTA
jgi:glycerol-3-phosphate acyltransferase PlsY